jgi:excisionase family DNA binding protein
MKLITIKQLAESISIKESTLYFWAARGEIPHYKIGQLVRFSPKEVEEWLEKFRKDCCIPVKQAKRRRRNSACSDVDKIVRKAIDEVIGIKV